jgi:hypothetical protein
MAEQHPAAGRAAVDPAFAALRDRADFRALFAGR